MRALILALALSGTLAGNARAQSEEPLFATPYAPAIRHHFYEQLHKRPWRALGYELLLPGVGSLYTGLHTPAAATLTLSLAGASMWLAGALRDRPALKWAGFGTFVAARSFGLVAAPLGAVLLNAAYRRQLGIVSAF